MKITKSPIETLLTEAANTLKKLPCPDLRQRTTIWPNTFSSRKIDRPSPEALTRLDKILDCLMPLKDEERRIIWARTNNMSWKRLAELENLSHVTLRKNHKLALKKIEKLMDIN